MVPKHVTRACLPMADDGAGDRHEHQTYDPRQRDNSHVGHLGCAQIPLIPEPAGRYFDRYGSSRRGRCRGWRRPTHPGRSAGNDRVGHMYLATQTSPGWRRRNSDRWNDRRGARWYDGARRRNRRRRDHQRCPDGLRVTGLGVIGSALP